MNEVINNEVQRIINEFRNRIGGKATRKQYAPAKHQIASLTNLGLMEYMPRGFGHGDADAVIREAMDAPKQVGGMVNGEGDVTTTSGSDLWKLLNPPAPEPNVETTTTETKTYYTSEYELSLLKESTTRVELGASPALDTLAHMMTMRKWIKSPEFIEPLDKPVTLLTGFDPKIGAIIHINPSGSAFFTHKAVRFQLTEIGERILAANPEPYPNAKDQKLGMCSVTIEIDVR